MLCICLILVPLKVYHSQYVNNNLERPQYLGVGEVSPEFGLFINTRRMGHKWDGVQNMVLYCMPFNMTYVKSVHTHLYLLSFPHTSSWHLMPTVLLVMDWHAIPDNWWETTWHFGWLWVNLSAKTAPHFDDVQVVKKAREFCYSGSKTIRNCHIQLMTQDGRSHSTHFLCKTGHTSFCNIIVMAGQQLCKEMAWSIRSNRMASKKTWLDTIGWRGGGGSW
jgi:hypothetical protein